MDKGRRPLAPARLHAACEPAENDHQLPVGDHPPELELEDLLGRVVSLQKLPGTVPAGPRPAVGKRAICRIPDLDVVGAEREHAVDIVGLERRVEPFNRLERVSHRLNGSICPMEAWEAFERAEPEMAEKGRALLYRRGDGEAFLTTVAANGTPRIHPLNVGVKDGHLLVFIQGHSAKARDLEANPHYALHAHIDPAAPHEFMVRGQARRVADAPARAAAAAGWFFTVADSYPLYELLIEHALLGERGSADEWPPRYRSWRRAI